MNSNKTASFLITSISIVVILIYGKDLLIPIVFALFLWFFIREINKQLDRIPFIKKKIPQWLKTFVTSLLMMLVMGAISKILTHNIQSLAYSYPRYEQNITRVISDINTTFKIDLISLTKEHITTFDFGSILNQVFNSVTEILGNAFIILLYAIFIFLEAANFPTKFQLIFTDRERSENVSNILERIETSITHYITLKTIVSILTGVLSYFALLLIGVDSPVFWSFLIFILNYIPTIGSLAGTLFPACFALLQFGELSPCIWVLVIVGSIQLLVGNIIEPKLMGSSLNISSLVALIALSFWGAIWGITGMIISVPVTVIIIIIFSQFDQTKAVAILLSEKGRINTQ